jgi:hypothetical protein
MTRVITYRSYQRPQELIDDEEKSGLMMAEPIVPLTTLGFNNQYFSFKEKLAYSWYDFTTAWKFPHPVNTQEAEGNIQIKKFWKQGEAFLLGGDYHHELWTGEIGFHYQLPFKIESNFLVNHKGKLHVSLEHEAYLSHHVRLFLESEWRNGEWEWLTEFAYQLNWSTRTSFLFTEDGPGVGLYYQF